jgi:restriction endonuclease S subunit
MKTVKLGDVCKVVSGFGFPKSHQGKPNQQYPFLKVSDMNLLGNEIYITTQNNTVSSQGLKVIKAKAYPKNTIIFPKIGAAIATNKKRILTQDSVFDNNVMGVIPDESRVDIKYLYFWISGKDLSDWASKSELPSMRKGTVEDTQLLLPSLEEQRRIVEKLDGAFGKIDRAIELTRASLQYSRTLRVVALTNIFIDSDKNIQWSQDSLSNLVEFKGGGTPSKSNPRYWSGTIPWVSPKDMKADHILDSQDHISELAVRESSTSLIPQGSILLVVRSGILVHTIPLAIAEVDVALNQDMKALIPSARMNKSFLYYLLRSREDALFSLVSKGATVHRINFDSLKKLQLRFPESREEQEKIAERAQAVSLAIQKIQRLYLQKLTSLEDIKKSLLDYAFKSDL